MKTAFFTVRKYPGFLIVVSLFFPECKTYFQTFPMATNGSCCIFRYINLCLCEGVCLSHRNIICNLQCSSTCAGGFQRRVVVCQDADGHSNSYCDERVKPAESKSCDSGPCPLWNFGVWGEVRSLLGVQNTGFCHTLNIYSIETSQ